MKSIRVVCGIIWKNGEVLIAKRKVEKSNGGYWEFPGGKIEHGEREEVALVRELNEELGMAVENPRYFDSHTHKYETVEVELIAYECDFVNATFVLADHDEIVFVEPKLLSMYNLAPADIYFSKKLLT